ncbi:MAG: molybdopterin-guanine dinucleotide biosynthesis protein A [Blastomonas sp. CACIA14H2]|uniref:molybdenum cofactor guanylyltransferase n=1 Tax=Blastomonas sp. CACIA14H2 TaxID=1419876 RepID=UPI0003D03BFD|nr:MAG: molybdopterin-guanine dinucleotide biosynthesis protein A [Blastomonas sp. CACIA14H2]
MPVTPPTEPLAEPLVVLLAGGQSRRMQGQDKALAEIGGQRMIDRVLARLAPQAGALWLSAAQDYGTGLCVIRDQAGAPQGPVGAIRSIASAVRAEGGDAFFTCPVDAPFVPPDLVTSLAAQAPLAMAETQGALQPVFALWSARAVLEALPPERCGERWSLHRLGEAIGMRAVPFADHQALMNVNTPQELEAARAHALEEPGKRLGASQWTRYSA